MAVAVRDLDNSANDLDQGITAAIDWAGARQDPHGFWVGMLESNACIESEWLLAFHVLGYDYPHADALVRGILQRQREDGSWEEEYWTGTGFPGVFYLRYHLYRVYFPLLALSSYRTQMSSEKKCWPLSA